MHQSIQELFEYAAQAVTDEDIRDFCPVDPGYPDYCEEMTRIRDSMTIPAESNFDIRETINLVGWAEPTEYASPERFLRFRRFTTAIGIGLEHRLALQGYSSGEIRAIYYLSYELLSGVVRTDPKQMSLTFNACQAARDAWATDVYDVIDDEPVDPNDPFEFQYIDDACSFYTFGMLYLAQLSNDWPISERNATQFIIDINEGVHPAEQTPSPFLIEHDPKGFPTLYRDWDSLFGELRNPTNHTDTQTVIDGLSLATSLRIDDREITM